MPNVLKDPAKRIRNNKPTEAQRTLAVKASGDIPDWPNCVWPAAFDKSTRKQVLDLWKSMWELPQAGYWRKQRMARQVGRLALMTIYAELSMQSSLLAEVRQLEDRLGLSPQALWRLGWSIEDQNESVGTGQQPTNLVDYRAMMAVKKAV